MAFLLNSQAQGVSGKKEQSTPVFFKENVRYPVWTRFLILGTRIGSLKRLKNPWSTQTLWRGAQCSCIGCIGLRPALVTNRLGLSLRRSDDRLTEARDIFSKKLISIFWRSTSNLLFTNMSS